MKKALTISGILLTMLSFSALSVRAADSFYLEIGHPASLEETNEQWQDLSTRYKSTLGKLTFYPKKILSQDGETASVIQAGPIDEKNKAQKFCNKLFAKTIPCFVIEGIENLPPSMAVDISRAATDSATRKVLFPWQIENAEHAAEVAVAQAIPVPLSKKSNEDDYEKIEVKPTFIPEQKQVVSSGGVKNFSAKEFASMETGGLIVQPFPDEVSSSKFWNYANNKFPELTDGLRVRVQRPLTAKGSGDIQVKIYYFPDGVSAGEFCNKVVSGFGMELECNYEIANSPSSRVQTVGLETPQIDKHQKPRQSSEHRVPVQQAEIVERKPFVEVRELPDESKVFWAQVAIAESKEEATNRWNEIKKGNAAAVKGVSRKLIYSAEAYAKYSVRLGSFADEEDAKSVCNKLQSRGVDCLVVSTN